MNELTSKRKRKPRRRLRSLKLDRVDFVEAGANPAANIAFAKADESTPVTKAAVDAELERKTRERQRAVSGETREQAQVEVMRAYPDLRERYAEATQPPSGPTRPLPQIEGEGA